MARRGQTVWVKNGFPDVDRKALKLDASSNYMRTAEVALGFGNTWTISLWGKNVYNSSNIGSKSVINAAPTSGALNRIWIGKTGSLATDTGLGVELSDSSGVGTKSVGISSGIWTLDIWRHVVVTFNGTRAAADEVTIYIDGVDMSYSGGPGSETTMSNTARVLALGQGVVASGTWLGMANFRYWGTMIWDAELDADAVAWLYNGGAPLGLNPNVNAGDYDYAADLLFWFQHGYEPTPNLGKNYLSGGGINLTSFSGVDDSDILSDYPTP